MDAAQLSHYLGYEETSKPINQRWNHLIDFDDGQEREIESTGVRPRD